MPPGGLLCPRRAPWAWEEVGSGDGDPAELGLGTDILWSHGGEGAMPASRCWLLYPRRLLVPRFLMSGLVLVGLRGSVGTNTVTCGLMRPRVRMNYLVS